MSTVHSSKDTQPKERMLGQQSYIFANYNTSIKIGDNLASKKDLERVAKTNFTLCVTCLN